MADPVSIDKTAKRLRNALQRRYPGVFVKVHFNDHVREGHGTYKGWCLSFEATDPSVLVHYGLVPINESGSFRSSGLSEFVGVIWNIYATVDPSKRHSVAYHIEEESRGYEQRPSPFTKKSQSLVVRMLKPFVRGTWRQGNALRGVRGA